MNAMRKVFLSVGMVLIALWLGGPALAAGEPHVAPIREFAAETIRSWAREAVLVEAVRAQNARTGGYDAVRIDGLDRQWLAELDSENAPMIEAVLGNAAHAIAGMVALRPSAQARAAGRRAARPALGITMFGVTTTAVQQISASLKDRYDCLVFHATGVGGRSMEKLADSGLMQAAIDLTTTEICDMMMGGVFAADEDRFGAFIRTRIPYVVSLGALDMVNFGPRDTVPDAYKDRLFVEHNPQVTLMRTTVEENARMGEWIAGRLNQMTGPVRLLIPEGGVSALDAPGQPFHDPAADKALFDAIARNFREAGNRRMIRLPYHINDPEFARACVAALAEIHPLTAPVSATRSNRHAAL